ncbi:TIR-NBS-LRR-like protein [Parasponia andersonii]|uniref:ADP-ribosyl cyclase/cyclic ADP-ribose hydrolase n=1 Tax=Parasponia andersonii TaxID=3476 RepID=A0A2P5BSX7_PARAD|nr:TIR-NBS-LRR-like protein [Parasponia andersonii]
MGLGVLPVFHNMEPSDVRKQTGPFGEAFAEHERVFMHNMDRLNKWRKALTQVANLSGWVLKNRRETEVIQEIVTNISKILNREVSISVDNGLIGMDSRIGEFLSYLGRGKLDDVRTIGIWGMGGIGKTTLAQEVFNRVKDQFEASCFIVNVREQSEKHGLVYLQKLLYSFLLESEANIQTVGVGTDILKDRLHRKRVLLILDDADKEDQIKYLAGEGGEQCEWFGRGSRILATTRDKKLLTRYGSNVYEVDKLTDQEALGLLCSKAGFKNWPADGYKEISNAIVKHVNGLPLALVVLGSFLINRTVEEWSDTLDRLRKYPEEDILCRLQLSVDGLRHTERQIFLDIACFFKGEDEYRVRKILQSSHYAASIKVLIEKALVTIVGDKLWMHDLLQELGWKIVREESSEPGKRSRLWLYEDAHRVLSQNEGTVAVEGLFLTLPITQKLILNTDPFSKMDKLRLLKIRNAANMLIWIDFSSCQYLTNTPDFSKIPNLERLILKGCKRLSKVHSSIGLLKRLVLLNLKGCESLKKLPRDISLESLEVLILSGCSKLNEFPEIKGNMERLSELHLDETAIVELPTSIKHLTGLSLLNLSGCKNLLRLPSDICSLTSLKSLNLSGCSCGRKGESHRSWRLCFPCCLEFLVCSESMGLQLPNSFFGLSSLRFLDLSHCNLSEQAIPIDLGCLSSLEYLALSGNNFTRIPESIRQLSKLRKLFLDGCSKLQSLQNLPPSITYINARDCNKLKSFSNQFAILTSTSGFCFMDFEKSDQDKGPKLHEIQMAPKHSLAMLLQYSKDKIYHKERFAYTIARTRIPDWCSTWSIGSSVTVQLPLDLNSNSKWIGLALCVVFVVQKQNSSDSKQNQFSFHFENGEGRLENVINLDIFVHENIDSYGLCYYVPREWFAGQLNKASRIEASVSTKSQELDVKMCGGHLIYDQTVDSIILAELEYYDPEVQHRSLASHEATCNCTSTSSFFSASTSPTPFSVHKATRTSSFRVGTSTGPPRCICCFWLTNEQLQSCLSFNFVGAMATHFKSFARWLMDKRSESSFGTSRTSLESTWRLINYYEQNDRT